MSTYINKFDPINIGGSNINNISTIVGNVSFNVLGNTYLNGSLNILNLSSDIATNINNNISNISSLNSRITLDETNIKSNIASISSENIKITSGSILNCNQLSSVSNVISIGNLKSTIYINGILYNPLLASAFSQW